MCNVAKIALTSTHVGGFKHMFSKMDKGLLNILQKRVDFDAPIERQTF